MWVPDKSTDSHIRETQQTSGVLKTLVCELCSATGSACPQLAPRPADRSSEFKLTRPQRSPWRGSTCIKLSKQPPQETDSLYCWWGLIHFTTAVPQQGHHGPCQAQQNPHTYSKSPNEGWVQPQRLLKACSWHQSEVNQQESDPPARAP